MISWHVLMIDPTLYGPAYKASPRELVRRLDADDHGVVASAAVELSRRGIKPTGSIRRILSLLRHVDLRVRMSAVAFASRHRLRRAVSPLVSMCLDPEETLWIQDAAGHALALIADPKARAALLTIAVASEDQAGFLELHERAVAAVRKIDAAPVRAATYEEEI